MNLNEFLIWLAAGGGAVGASWVLEQFAWFQKLEAIKKQYVFFASCVALSLGAFAVQTYVPAGVLEQLSPWFAVIATTFVGIFGGSLYHRSAKKPEGQG